MAITAEHIANWIEQGYAEASDALRTATRCLTLWSAGRVERLELTQSQKDQLRTDYEAAKTALAAALAKLP